MRLLSRLSCLYHVQTAYYDVFGRSKRSSPEALMRVLRMLGAPVERMKDVPDALRERQQWLWQRCIEPVIVAWGGGPVTLELRLPMNLASGPLALRLEFESGGAQEFAYSLSRLSTATAYEIEGIRHVIKRLHLRRRLPWGYHRLTLEIGGNVFKAMVVSAPVKAYTGPEKQGRRRWGAFLPLYSLHSGRSWGSGDFTDLEALAAWVNGLGGTVVGTLPLLAAFLDEPFEPSPYAPASRLFWNEFFLDVTRIPEFEHCPAVQSLVSSAVFKNNLGALGSAPLVDYRRQMALKRRVLEQLAQNFFASESARHSAFRHFVETHSEVEDYARFRATCERHHSSWPSWPQRLRDGLLRPGDYDEEGKRYHLYAQWLVHEQLGALAEKAKTSGSKLYLDLPLGVHPHGYDVWRERDIFVLDALGGAPPDSVFTQGQSWGFLPVHPEKIREEGYRYIIAMLRHHLNFAGLLRIDHVMGLHRLFWIPKGLEPREGVFVRYRAEEFYAILSLESHRHQTMIVGENLGTVPAYVNSAMARHDLQRMYVVQYEAKLKANKALPPVPRHSVASLNTHDMRPFAAFWEGLDIRDWIRLALIDKVKAKTEEKKRLILKRSLVSFLRKKGWLQNRSAGPENVLEACLFFLSASQARVVLINLEDLWLEREPQNVPSTRDESLNWQRKARYSFEAFSQMPEVLDTLRGIDRLRR